MAETEVESILREIRERVLAQQRAGQASASTTASLETSHSGNGAGEAGAVQQVTLIDSYLTTTARTWDRLPPLVSNRSGPIARFELWLKRRLKTGTRWFTWEQVNFNAAVHHALRDLLALLSAHEQELAKLRAQMRVETEARQLEREQHQNEVTSRLTQLRADFEAQLLAIAAQNAQINSSLAQLASELRERDEHLREEQRVCFKQLALETSEAAVLEDRARRKTEALLEELQSRIGQLEKSKSDN